jgi:hypothetical protein
VAQRAEPEGAAQGRYLLSAVLKIGWRVVRASPEEQAVLDAPRVEERKGCSDDGIIPLLDSLSW